MVIPAGVIISQRLSLIMIINWGGVLWEKDRGGDWEEQQGS